MARLSVLVTGGEGFVGAHLSRRLADDGHDVHILSRPNPGRKWKLLDLLGVVARVHPVDLLDRDGLVASIAAIRPQRVFHLAGRVDLDRSSAVARLCIEENVHATINLLEALRGVPIESFLYASTTEVYGGAPPPFHEDQPVDPPSPYSVSKVAAESLCRLWARSFGCPTRIVRLASAYGPGQPVQRIIPSVILAAIRGEPVTLKSPRHRRDFLFVADAVDGIVKASEGSLPAGDVLNLGTREAVAIEDLARAILAETGVATVLTAVGGGRPDEAPRWATDASKATALLGWAPRVSLHEGLVRTVAWYRELAERGQA